MHSIIREIMDEITSEIVDQPYSMSSPPIPVIHMQKDLQKSMVDSANKNAVYFTIEGEDKYSIIISTENNNESKKIKTNIINAAIKYNLIVDGIYILPLDPISSYPIINILDEISSKTFLSQKSKQYWKEHQNISDNIKEYYLDYMNYRKELCLTYFPELELYNPSWMLGMSSYIIYSPISKTQLIRNYENTLKINEVYVRIINEELTYNNVGDKFKECFSIPSNLTYISSRIEGVGDKINFFMTKKHPFIIAINDIKEGIRRYNDEQEKIDFDALKITYSDLFNRTLKYISEIRILSSKYEFLRYYFKPWNNEISVSIMYFVDQIKPNRRPDGEIIMLFKKSSVDNITIKKIRDKEEFRTLLTTFPSNDMFVKRSNSTLSYYFKDKIQSY